MTRLAPVLLHTPPGVLGLLGLHAVPSATREPQGLPSAELVRPLNHYLSARFLSNAGALGLSQAALVLVLGLDGGSFARSLRDIHFDIKIGIPSSKTFAHFIEDFVDFVKLFVA